MRKKDKSIKSMLKTISDLNFGLALSYTKKGDGPSTIRHLLLAKESGEKHAFVLLGLCYQHGFGVDVDMKASVRHFKLAHPIPDASYYLAKCYETGAGVDSVDKKTAFELFRMAANNGHADAQYIVARHLLKSEDREDWDASLSYLKSASQQGHLDAGCRLGCELEIGTRTKRDIVLALSYYKIGARDRHGMSAFFLGRCYAYGRGVTQNAHMALENYEISAFANCPYGQLALGLTHYNKGSFCSHHVELFQRAATFLPSAIVALANCYWTGHGVAKDEAAALELYNVANGEECKFKRCMPCAMHPMPLTILYPTENDEVRCLKRRRSEGGVPVIDLF